MFPEEGKYRLTGHRRCGISQTPDETNPAGTKCPEYGRSLTSGILHRVRELGSESQTKGEDRRAYVKLTPLLKLLARTMQRGKRAKVVGRAYHGICNEFGGEIQVLTRAGFDDLRRVGGEDLAVAVTKVRTGQVE